MVTIDEHLARLKTAQKTGWKNVPGQPDIAPAHEATLLWEQFREMARFNDREKRPAEYRAKRADAEKTADEFRALLKQNPGDRVKMDDAFQQIGQSCVACHKAYRN